eukprot:GHRQ01002772.1.p1 GENE.GHRQ01002772.1~~GHRQ01002772.1.p1  ORF type:complete len:288 (+),score=87.78 GHRQ01002772.1:235-1098(+)
MAYVTVRLEGNPATAFSTSNRFSPQGLRRPKAAGTATATAARCRCTAEPQPPAATAAADTTGRGTYAGGSAGPAAKLQLPAAPELPGSSPQGRWNAVSLAFLGDAVWEALLRGHFYNPANLRQYGRRVAALVTTQAQAAAYQLLVDEPGWLSPQEAALMRWATNSASVAPPSHATRQQYKQATAVEALVASLYLTDAARLQQLMAWLLQARRLKRWQQQLPAQVPTPASAARKRSAGKQACSSSSHDSAVTKANQRDDSASSSTRTTGGGSRRACGSQGPQQRRTGA